MILVYDLVYDTGLFQVWDAGVVLAMHIANAYGSNATHKLKGGLVVELGAGPALPSIVAACCGAKCIVTDQNPTLTETCTPNADSNFLAVNATKLGGSLHTQELQWGTTEDSVVEEHRPLLVLGADIIYNEDHFDVLVRPLFLRDISNVPSHFLFLKGSYNTE